MASTNPKRVSVLMEKPMRPMNVKVPTSDTGMAIRGISMTLQFCKKIRMTINTSKKAVPNVLYISLTDARMNSVVSSVIFRCTPSGKYEDSVFTRALIRWATFKAFAPGS